jgi:hypothetical protein
VHSLSLQLKKVTESGVVTEQATMESNDMTDKKEQQRRSLYELLDEQIADLDSTKQEAFCMSQERYQRVLEALLLKKGE